MTESDEFLALYRALLWRLWIEQGAVIVVVPLLMALLFLAALLAMQFAPHWLAEPASATWQAGASMGDRAGPGTLAQTFVEYQAPALLTLLSSLSAAEVGTRMIGTEAERGELELLLATRHDANAIGGATLLTAWTMAGAGWAMLIGSSFLLTQVFGACLPVRVSSGWPVPGATLAMQFVLTLLAAELALIGQLLFPGLSRARGGAGDPATLLALSPAFAVFLFTNLCPQVPSGLLSLCALDMGLLLLVGGAVSIQWWFRPDRFLMA